ncbi:endonuclease VIII [Budviciaceae bacterium BWR-B9]|uniref:Endonuclease VIII n=1 Tax=Limnobaculum allomyrinae TaxID=2791986 RepID=A0ABS1IM25_9GAMM|nr:MULTISPECIES: endonuclease VIII [Limnobaculum]MBK5142788.1 endonuclease VIII [Limnobaculum allomyrinae]MBV7690325.1 endonuclease VIII [Limnobaculum sp. M2-1]
MPEGPEIRRAADKLVDAVEGKALTSAWFAFPELKVFERQLIGQTVTSIETRGKALLTHFSSGLCMYSHNQLYGIWKVAEPGKRPETKRDLRVALETVDKAILLYSASDIELAPLEIILQHPFLQRIGPDVLDMTLTEADICTRLLDKAFRRRQLGGMLLDQAFLAGLGNYLRAEILWAAELLPHHKPESLTELQLDKLAHALISIPRLSYQTRGEVNPNHHHGALFEFHVFAREGQVCERCGAVIQKTALSSRPFYYCGGCQE